MNEEMNKVISESECNKPLINSTNANFFGIFYKENVVCNLALSTFSVHQISTEGGHIDCKDLSKLLNYNDLVLQSETSCSTA